MGPRYAKRLLTGIPEHRCSRLSAPGGTTIQANHPTFILGHLALYPIKVLQHLGLEDETATPPENYEKLFSKTATCQDDPDGRIYPPISEIVPLFERSYASAIEAIRRTNNEQLNAPNPVDTPMKEICPTLGSLLAFYLTGHVMTHLGQLSTWRRMEGLPPA
jgi:hypothetical protein